MRSASVFKALAFIMCILFITQCKKDFLGQTNKEVNQVNSFVRNALITKWGCIINGSASTPANAEKGPINYLKPVDEKNLALQYGVTYIRTGVTKEQWDTGKAGFLYVYDQYATSGFRMLLTITWQDSVNSTTGERVPVPFVADATNKKSDYYKYVKNVIDTLTSGAHVAPMLVVVENEETNKNYHILNDTTDYRKYVNMVSAVVTICSPKNIPVTNGGLTARALTFSTHDWLKSFPKRVAEAQTYAWNSMPPSAYYTLYPPPPSGMGTIGKNNIASQVDMVNFYISNYKVMNMGGINVHWYEPVKIRFWDDTKNNSTAWAAGVSKNDLSPGAMVGMLEYVTKTGTPLKVISNEVGQLTNSDCLTQKIMDTINSKPYGAFAIASWFDCDLAEPYGAKALHNTYTTSPLYKPRNAGIMFQQKIANSAGSYSCTPVK